MHREWLGAGEALGYKLSKCGYTITESADAAGVEERDIEVALATNKLSARRVPCMGSDRAIVLHADLVAWLETMPRWIA
ncbi:hypothetical protein RCH22_001005 [Cryobacterium psychrotolerans]|nr:hypothetical protein [Cryobacterium psychrotolerans]MEC5149285.1 hypothetical protein [Cryobacterium psychrotolerans]MEC5149364.1 hypothetical protein [Cryobacterium psychrotolerans]